MPDLALDADTSPQDATAPDAAARKRPKPGERRVQILQALATMLEQPGAERVTTSALAAKLGVSEAALYRHFASKAQMFEGLIEFIEQSVFTLVNQIADREADPAQRTRRLVTMVLQFAEKNPGMTRVMVGDALVFENDRLQERMNQFFDKLESSLKQSLRDAATASGAATPTVDAQVRASVAVAFMVGRLQRYARSGFKRLPSEHLDASLAMILG
jgi:TetR/AcrR family transcriptional regulator